MSSATPFPPRAPKNLANSPSGRKENSNNQNYKHFIVLLQYAYLHKCLLFLLLDQPDQNKICI